MIDDITYRDRELFKRISEGDEDAFKELYQLLHPVLKGFIVKILKSEEDVMEIIQESLLRLWLNRDKLADLEYPRTYFFRIVTNECYRYFRKHGLQDRLLTELEHASGTKDIVHTTDLEVSYRETIRIIHKAVQTLSPRQREIYVLSRDHGLKISEIAEKLEITPKYVKKTLIIALKNIRKKLVEAGRFALSLLLGFFL